MKIQKSKAKSQNLKKYQNRISKRPGQVMIIAIVFLAVVLILASSLFSRVAEFLHFSSTSVVKEQAGHLAEAGVDYTIRYLNKNPSGPNPPSTEIQLGTTGSFIVQVTDKTSQLKTVTSTGYVPNATNPRIKRKIKVDIKVGITNIAFHYAVQVGNNGLTMSNTATINGTVYSNGSIMGYNNPQINGDAYAYTTIGNPPNVTGSRHEYSPQQPLPTFDVQPWKDKATQGGTTICNPICNITTTQNIGPQKYVGDLQISNNAVVTMEGPIWITGNFSMSQGQTTLQLDNNFGSLNTVMVIEGKANLTQGGSFVATNASPKGYIMLVTTSTDSQALQISQAAASAIFYALNGGASLAQSANVTALIASQLTMSQSAQLNFDTGLASATFSSGPGGGWEVKKGTYNFPSF